MKTAAQRCWTVARPLLLCCLGLVLLAGCATPRMVYPFGKGTAGQGYVDLYECYVTEHTIKTYWNSFVLDCAPADYAQLRKHAARPVRYQEPLTRLALPAGRYLFSHTGLQFEAEVEPGRIKSYCIYTFKDTETRTSSGNYYTVSVNCRLREIGTLTDPALNLPLCLAELMALLQSGVEIKQYYACLMLATYGDASALPALQQLKAEDDRFRSIVGQAISSIKRRPAKM